MQPLKKQDCELIKSFWPPHLLAEGCMTHEQQLICSKIDTVAINVATNNNFANVT